MVVAPFPGKNWPSTSEFPQIWGSCVGSDLDQNRNQREAMGRTRPKPNEMANLHSVQKSRCRKSSIARLIIFEQLDRLLYNFCMSNLENHIENLTIANLIDWSDGKADEKMSYMINQDLISDKSCIVALLIALKPIEKKMSLDNPDFVRRLESHANNLNDSITNPTQKAVLAMRESLFGTTKLGSIAEIKTGKTERFARRNKETGKHKKEKESNESGIA